MTRALNPATLVIRYSKMLKVPLPPTLAVLFGGNTRLKLHWIDLYDLNSGTHLN